MHKEIIFPDVAERPVTWFEEGHFKAPDHKAIVDLNSGHVFSIVSRSFSIGTGLASMG